MWQWEQPSQSNADCIEELEKENRRIAAANLALGIIVSKLCNNFEHIELLTDIIEYTKFTIKKDEDINNLNLQLNQALLREHDQAFWLNYYQEEINNLRRILQEGVEQADGGWGKEETQLRGSCSWQ